MPQKHNHKQKQTRNRRKTRPTRTRQRQNQQDKTQERKRKTRTKTQTAKPKRTSQKLALKSEIPSETCWKNLIMHCRKLKFHTIIFISKNAKFIQNYVENAEKKKNWITLETRKNLLIILEVKNGVQKINNFLSNLRPSLCECSPVCPLLSFNLKEHRKALVLSILFCPPLSGFRFRP